MQPVNTVADAPVPIAVPAGADARPHHGSPSTYWGVVASHALVDVFPMIITSLMIVLQQRLDLAPWQETAVWIATPIFSGGCQPLFAWLGDRYDTRLAGPVGLAVGAVSIGSIGFATTFWQLIALQVVGVIGVGMYHPAAAATAGQIGARVLRHGRAFALSVFVASGMVGHTLAPIVTTRVNAWWGMANVAWVIPPALAAAFMLHRVMRHARHRPHNHGDLYASASAVPWARGAAVVLLCLQNALRFTVNNAVYILCAYWCAWRIAGSDAAAILNGNLMAATTIGMGVGAVMGGRFIRRGRERRAFALTAFAGACFIGVFNVAAQWGTVAAAAAAGLSAVGFFCTIAPSVGLAQRLLPTHASLATALLLGVAWMIGASSRPLASMLLGVDSLRQARSLSSADFNRAFAGLAVLLALAGVLALLMPGSAVRRAASHD